MAKAKHLKPRNGAADSERMTRAERSEATQRAIFEATVKVVGERGYADASIGRIAERANVAQGTFYNYYASQQQLFNDLLPLLGDELIGLIRARRNGIEGAVERERAGFEAFFDYLLDVPEFYRILNEAETFASESHRRHTQNMASGYTRALARAKAEGRLAHFEEHEFEAVGYMLIAIRHYLAMRYTYRPTGVKRIPKWVPETYMKLLRHGLFSEPSERVRTRRPPRREPDAAGSQPRIVEIGAEAVTVEIVPDSDGTETAILKVGRAAAVAMAEAVAGSPQGLVSFDVTVLDAAAAGRIVARASIEGRSANDLIVAVRIVREDRAEAPLALIRARLAPRED